MTTGKKIKRIRLLRGLTQKELGIAAGLHPYIADTRISQYEIDDRVPKKELLEKIAIALGVSVLSLQPFVAGTSDADIMLCLMDIEDEWGSRMLLDSSKQGKSGIFLKVPESAKFWTNGSQNGSLWKKELSLPTITSHGSSMLSVIW